MPSVPIYHLVVRTQYLALCMYPILHHVYPINIDLQLGLARLITSTTSKIEAILPCLLLLRTIPSKDNIAGRRHDTPLDQGAHSPMDCRSGQLSKAWPCPRITTYIDVFTCRQWLCQPAAAVEGLCALRPACRGEIGTEISHITRCRGMR